MDNLSPIEQAEREIQRDKDDLKRLKKRYPGYDFVRVDVPKVSISANGYAQNRVGVSEVESGVLEVINDNPDGEWTSRSMVEFLRVMDKTRLPEKDDAAMNAVGYALIALKEAGKILRVHEGKGRDPHRYKALSKVIEKVAAPDDYAQQAEISDDDIPF